MKISTLFCLYFLCLNSIYGQIANVLDTFLSNPNGFYAYREETANKWSSYLDSYISIKQNASNNVADSLMIWKSELNSWSWSGTWDEMIQSKQAIGTDSIEQLHIAVKDNYIDVGKYVGAFKKINTLSLTFSKSNDKPYQIKLSSKDLTSILFLDLAYPKQGIKRAAKGTFSNVRALSLYDYNPTTMSFYSTKQAIAKWLVQLPKLRILFASIEDFTVLKNYSKYSTIKALNLIINNPESKKAIPAGLLKAKQLEVLRLSVSHITPEFVQAINQFDKHIKRGLLISECQAKDISLLVQVKNLHFCAIQINKAILETETEALLQLISQVRYAQISYEPAQSNDDYQYSETEQQLLDKIIKAIESKGLK